MKFDTDAFNEWFRNPQIQVEMSMSSHYYAALEGAKWAIEHHNKEAVAETSDKKGPILISQEQFEEMEQWHPKTKYAELKPKYIQLAAMFAIAVETLKFIESYTEPVPNYQSRHANNALFKIEGIK